jgi:hypothetical protein
MSLTGISLPIKRLRSPDQPLQQTEGYRETKPRHLPAHQIVLGKKDFR